MTVQFSVELLEKYLAPGINACRPANIIDFTQEVPDSSWIENHFLNSIFGSNFDDTWRARFVVIAFRTRAAFAAWDRARLASEAFVAKSIDGNPASNIYFEAVSQWEMVILNLHHAGDVIRQIAGASFQEDDDVKNLRLISNRIKHAAEDIQNGLHGDLTLPMWMTSCGLKTRLAEISFVEIADCLRSLVKIVDDLQNPSALLKQSARSEDATPNSV